MILRKISESIAISVMISIVSQAPEGKPAIPRKKNTVKRI